jgi:two-component SAPR family response regulator
LIKAILIDDERPALRGLEAMLKKYADIEILGMYLDPFEGIEKVREASADIVFLDINMPQLGGIDAASLIYKARPDTDVVFVTAYEEFAVKAYELSALDYLLKPVNAARLEISLERLRKKHAANSTGQTIASDRKLAIRCLGGFEVSFLGCAPIKWRAEKTKELFAFLLHNMRRNITKDEILDALWQRDIPDKAVRQLYNGIYYIRKAFVDYGIDRSLLCIDENYHLHATHVDFDVSRFYMLHKQAHNRMDTLERMEALYTGDYLGTLPYDWAVFERQQLLETYIQCVIELSSAYMDIGRYDDAAAILMKAYRHDPLSESVTKCLLTLYRKTQNKTAAVRHYSSYCTLLRKELDIEPSGLIRQLID